MATVTGMTADRMLAIEQASVVDGDVVGDNLILIKKSGQQIDAGSVRGAPGPAGPMGSALVVVSAAPVLDVGTPNQLRAGRQLSAADFTNMGLNVPVGLWNLSNVNDSSGNGRALTNKAGIPFGVGVNGLATTAAVFAGSTAQGLFIADIGAADPFRIKTGTIGCWMRTAKRGVIQDLISKASASLNNYIMRVTAANVASLNPYDGGTTAYTICTGTTDIADDRWHFIVGTFDGGKARLYVDGMLEGPPTNVNPLTGGGGPLSLGGSYTDTSIATVNPMYGRMDEVFISPDVLSDDQIRMLYCAKIPHALGQAPSSVSLSVRRRKRGGALVSADFPSQPARLYNFTGGALTDEGSNNTPVVATPATGSITVIAGADGSKDGGYYFLGAQGGLLASDAGMPSGLSPRSFGFWIKFLATGSMGQLQWGVTSTGEARVDIFGGSSASFRFISNADVITVSTPMNDGLWHHICEVDDNAAGDGLKRKIYYDGEIVGSSTIMNAITLAGANGFRIGNAGGSSFSGHMDGVFVFPGVLTPEQVRVLYNKGSQQLAASPKAPGDHIEAIGIADLLVSFETIESSDFIDLAVTA